MQTLARFFNIRPGEGRPVLILAVYYFCLMAASVTGRSVSSALFLSRVSNGEVLLPLLLLPVAVTAAVTVAIYTRLAQRVALLPLLASTSVFFALTLAVLMPLLSQSWALVAFYIWMEVINNIIFFQFYVFAAAIFDTRQAKRIFGVLPVGGAVATMFGGLALTPFTTTFGSAAVLLLAAGFILLSVLAMGVARPFVRQSSEDKKPEPAEKQEPIRLDAYLKTIIIVVALTILVATIADYQYKLIAKHEFGDNEVELTAFFGQVSALIGLLQLGMRLFVVSPLLTNFGVLAGLVILPAVNGINTLLVLLSPTLLTGALLRTVDASTRFSLNETSMELLWVPVTPRRKLRFRPLVSATVPAITQSAAGLLSFLVVTLVGDHNIRVIAIGLIILAAVILWIPMTFRLRGGYIAELMASIQQRELALEDLNLDESDATTVAIIDRSLNSSDEVEQAFALGMIEQSQLTPWSKTLSRLFLEGSFHIRQKVLEIAARYPDVIPNDALRRLIEGEPQDLTDEAIIAASKRGMVEIIPLLEPHLTSAKSEIRAAAASAVLLLNQGPVEQAQDVLRAMLEGATTGDNVIALNTLSALPTAVASAVVHESMLRETLGSQSTRARRAVLEMLVNPGYWAKEQPADNETIVAVAYNLRKPATQPVAEKVLRNYSDAHVVEVLTTLLRDRGSPLSLRLGIIHALRGYPVPAVVEQIITLLNLDNRALYAEAVNTLLVIARQSPLPPTILKRLDDHLLSAARIIYTCCYLVEMVGPDEPLIAELIAQDIQELLPALLKLSVMDVPETDIETIIEQVLAQPTPNLGNALEVLENVLTRAERDIIIPLFDISGTHTLARIGERHFGLSPASLDGELKLLIASQDEWRSLVALDFAVRKRHVRALQQVDWLRVPDSPENRELVSRLLQQDGDTLRERIPALRFAPLTGSNNMYSTLEKTIMLKSVLLFKDINAREIYHIAQITEEEHFKPGEALFREGDAGDCLYILVRGRVRVHKDDQEIAIFQKGDALGEMALFDRLPRSASATALEETDVLRISQEKFYELMATRMEIMQSIVRLLSLRLRTATERVSDLLEERGGTI